MEIPAGGLPVAVFAKGWSALPLCLFFSSDLAEACAGAGRQFAQAWEEETIVLAVDSVFALGDTQPKTADTLRNL